MPEADLPYPLPPAGTPVRVAFVAQRAHFDPYLLREQTPGVVPAVIDFRDGDDAEAMLKAVGAHRPDVVVCLRPASVPAGAFAGLRAPVLGVITESLPDDSEETRPDLQYNLAELHRADRGNFDRVICCDAAGADAARPLLPLWRSMPLPVADACFAPPRPSAHPPRVIFVGHSSTHREQALIGLKHRFDVRHYAHGLVGDDLLEALAASDVGIALHSDRWMQNFEHNVLLHLASGHLLLSEPLAVGYGLEPGIDYLEVASTHELDLRVHQLHERPDAFDRIRIRGHHSSRRFRASLLWPRVIGDLLADLRAFGTERTPA